MPNTPRNQFEYQDDRAESYDSRRSSEAKWQAEQTTFEDFLAMVAPTPARILDVPVGTGRFLELYARLGHEAIGIDVSSDMLAQATLKQQQLLEADITLRVGDITALDMDPYSVDVAVCSRLFNLVDAAFLPRDAERQRPASMTQLPPRMTLSMPASGFGGSVRSFRSPRIS